MNETAKAFLAGALVPTIAIYFLRHRLAPPANDKNIDDNDEVDDDDSVSSGQLEGDDDDNNVDVAVELPCKDWGMMHAPYKMVLCVNTDLSMGKGKIAAQCCHAAVGCYKRAVKHCPAALRAWELTGCAKIALKCPNVDEMELIAVKAMSKDIPFYIVEDAGRTQIAAGSRTVLGLFGPTSVFEGVTDHLKLM
jgi:PTH2 family peptidyl-tRNA hydrolase